MNFELSFISWNLTVQQSNTHIVVEPKGHVLPVVDRVGRSLAGSKSRSSSEGWKPHSNPAEMTTELGGIFPDNLQSLVILMIKKLSSGFHQFPF